LIVLALDTALSAATAVVACDGDLVAARVEPMGRGHQEAIAGLVRAAMADAGVRFHDLDRIGVTIGPGSFTGLRVGIAFAKGLALAWSTPLVGIGALEALAASADGVRVAAAIDAGRGQVYLLAGSAPLQAPIEDALRWVADFAPDVLVGSGAALMSAAAPNARLDERGYPTPEALVRLSGESPAPLVSPKPLYLRAPDAKTLAERGVGR
jgi:tRNA threonylcarbamoyladenosine biosynthesis protein TsaB